MDLKNDYKVIYEHRTIVDELTRHLKATKTLPADSDANVVYKDNLGTEISADTLKTFKLVYEKNGSIFGSTSNCVTTNDTNILVYNGSDLVLGKFAKILITHIEESGITVTVPTEALVGETVTVAVTGEGVTSSRLPTVTINGVVATGSWISSAYQVTFTASIDTVIDVKKYA